MGRRGFRRTVAALGMGVVLAGALVVLIELVFYALNRLANDGIGGEEPYLFAFDESLGYRPLANTEARAYKTHNGETLFDVTYRTDAVGRRVTPAPDCEAEPSEFIAFFGGSFTFGHGLEDGETLPALTQNLLPGYRAYNYGFSGYGPQQALVKIRSRELSHEIEEETGTAVYVFMGHHIPRAIGSMQVWTQWGRHFPYFRLAGDGTLEQHGSFLSGRPFRSKVYDLLKHDQVSNYFNIDVPIAITEKHLKLTAAMLHAAGESFCAQYPKGRFIVLIYPASPSVRFDRKRFVEILRSLNLDILDLSESLDMTDARFHIPYDGHPTAEAHRMVANALAAYLQNADG